MLLATTDGSPVPERDCVAEALGHVLPDRVSFVAVDPALTLFEVHGVRWQVPVDDRVAVLVEIEAFLADRCGREYERPEGRVKGLAYLLGTSCAARIALLCLEPQGEASAHPLLPEVDLSGSVADLVYPEGGGADRQSADDGCRYAFGDLLGRLSLQAQSLTQDMGVLVQDRLEVPVGAVLDNPAPVRLGAICAPDESRDLWEVEQASKRPGNSRRGLPYPRFSTSGWASGDSG